LQIRFDQIKIYYFSGTGNAKKVTGWITDVAKNSGYKPEVNNIAETNVRDIKPVPNSLIGIISPTHGFNFPPLVLNFIFRFPRSKGNIALFMINTRAGMKLSKIFLPGLSGIAQLLAALVLILKGYKIVGMRPIDLPSNWISLHPGIKATVVDSMFTKCKRQSEAFINKILDGKRNYRSLFDILQDLLVSPIAFGYYFVGRFMLAKTFYAARSCDNCGLCISQCPVKAISLVQNRPFWSYRCESCMKCMNSCVNKSIQTAHGFFIGFLFLFYGVILVAAYTFFDRQAFTFITGDSLYSALLRFIFEASAVFLTLIITYRLVHFLRRFRYFDYLIYYTSFTRFNFWRRYKAPSKA
jgi:ferredoxin